MKQIFYLCFLILFLSSKSTDQSHAELSEKKYDPGNELFDYRGRTEIREQNTAALIGSASSVKMAFKGESCTLFLKGEFDRHNYITLVLDGKSLGRSRVEGNMQPRIIEAGSTTRIHQLEVFKDTEAASGSVLFEGLMAQELVPLPKSDKKTIEFIGNSITCGALSDAGQMPCDQGEYLDHHNAYMAYGPQVARALDVDFLLSSVSGIGVYRNWNDENIEEPIMPQVYDNLYLNRDTMKPYVHASEPDVISICLGTNDLSGGDGKKLRLPFNAEKFTQNYMDFVAHLFERYPATQIVLLNSPMLDEEHNKILTLCLQKVQAHFKDKKIALFEFDRVYVGGCGYHPSTEDHTSMAARLTPFFKKVLND